MSEIVDKIFCCRLIISEYSLHTEKFTTTKEMRHLLTKMFNLSTFDYRLRLLFSNRYKYN